ncbi:TolC family protein [Pelobium manganitolerans]|uniref:TolC family protein n=1 Tax=Pelobium manganitolerans TaxID=1842495 RepID=UPI000E74194A|nr:TolC family protein [Pelobium manganitolerans]
MISFTKKFLLSLSLLAGIGAYNRQAFAQQSMVPDVSYLFLEKLIATAKQNYPVVKQNKIKEEIADLQVKQQVLNWFSPLSVSYLSQPNNTINLVDPRFFTGYQVGVSVNIGEILQKPGNVKIAKKNLAFTEQLTAQSDNNLELLVKQRYFLYIQQLNNVKLFTKSLQDAEGLLNDLKLRYERGEVTFKDYSEGLIGYSTISQSKIESEALLLTAKASIEELTVTKLEDIK